MQMENKCLYCYKEIKKINKDFHDNCSRKFFGDKLPPQIDFLESELESRGIKLLERKRAITGVQTKLSLEKSRKEDSHIPARLTITGISGGYILKPPTDEYPFMPELEDLSMHLARLAGIKTVPHSLIRMKSGRPAYITRRIDRKGKNKIHMEDMCQLTGRLTENKYSGSYEQIAKTIRKYTARELDIINFTELVLFSFITGNSDMHLKNFSLIKTGINEYSLSPAYDLLPVKLLLKSDEEETALTLDGKKKYLTIKNFQNFADSSGINRKAFNNILRKYSDAYPSWINFIKMSFIDRTMQDNFISLITDNMAKLKIAD
jgi:serine/threonine-protein kinase HipA